MQESGDKRITIVRGSKKNTSGSLPSKKKLTLFSLFSSSSKSSPFHVSRTHTAAVKNWAALEEKIIHDYKERTAQPRNVPFLSKTPTDHSHPILDDFTAHTAVPSSLRSFQPKGTFHGKRIFSAMAVILLISGWLTAGVFVFLHSQETFSNRLISQKLVQLQTEKKQLKHSYALLKGSFGDQRMEMKLQNAQLRDMASELQTTKTGGQAFEKKYRDELMRLTLRYESELAALRSTTETQNAVISALKAQNQAFDKIVDQVEMSAFSGAAAGLAQPFSTEGNAVPQGKVTTVDRKKGSVVISMGAEQGVRSGRWVNISRNGVDLAVGLVDRVYSTMSVALVRNQRMLQVIQEGDSVFLS